MQSRILLLVTVFSLAPYWNAPAQDKTLAGEVFFAPTQVEVKGNRAKFNEYRDLRDGFYGHIGLQYDREETFLNFRGDNIGHKDQRYELEGGSWGSFKYHLGYDEIPHNFGLGNGPSVNRKTFVR